MVYYTSLNMNLPQKRSNIEILKETIWILDAEEHSRNTTEKSLFNEHIIPWHWRCHQAFLATLNNSYLYSSSQAYKSSLLHIETMYDR